MNKHIPYILIFLSYPYLIGMNLKEKIDFNRPPAVPSIAVSRADISQSQFISAALYSNENGGISDSRSYSLASRSLSFAQLCEPLFAIEAERLLKIALGVSKDIQPHEAAAVSELQSFIEGSNKSQKSESPLVEQARKLYAGTQQNKKSGASRKSGKVLAKAHASVAANASTSAEKKEINEVRNAIVARVVRKSSNLVVHEALSEHRKSEDLKIRLLKTACAGKCGELQRLIGLGASLDARDRKGNSSLALAALNNKYAAALLLVRSGVPVTTFNDDGLTPLDLAEVTWGTEKIVSLLKSAGAGRGTDANKEKIYELVQMELVPERVEFLRSLLRIYSPNMRDSDSGLTLVFLAARKGLLNVVQLLVEEFYVRLNSVNNIKETVLDVSHRFPLVMDYLKSRCALTYDEVKIRDKILELARLGDCASLRQLIAQEKKKNQDNSHITRLLNSTDEAGMSALAHAVKNKREEMVRALALEYNVELSAIAEDGYTPLDIAFEEELSDIFGFLQSKGALKNYYVDQQLTPATESRNFLEYARQGQAGQLEALINNGINIDDIRDGNGNCALALAVLGRHNDAVRKLLDADADCNALNDEGLSVLDLSDNSLDSIRLQLQKKGALSGKHMHIKNILFQYVRDGRRFTAREINLHGCFPDWSGKPDAEVQFEELLRFLQAKYEQAPTLFPQFVMMTDSNGQTLLSVAVSSSQIITIRTLLAQFPQLVNIWDNERKTPLDRAQYKFIAETLENKYAFTFDELVQRIKLMRFAAAGKLDEFKQELNGIKRSCVSVSKFFFALDSQNNAPLILAARFGHLAIAKHIIDNEHIVAHIQTAQKAASDAGHESLARYLADKNRSGDPLKRQELNTGKETDSTLRGFLGKLSRSGRSRTDITSRPAASSTQEFARKSSDANIRNEEEDMQLLLSNAEKGKIDVMRQLISRRVDVNGARDKNGNTALMLTVLRGREDCMHLLLQSGAEINVVDDRGLSPLDIAEFLRNGELVSALKQQGALNGAIVKNWLIACEYIRQGLLSEFTSLLATTSIPINFVDKRGTVLILLAARHNRLAFMRLLVEGYGAKLDSTDREGNTACTLAAQEGHLEVVTYTCEKGVDFNQPNVHDKTPLDRSISGGHQQVISFLRARKALTCAQVIERKNILKAAKENEIENFKDQLKIWEQEGFGLEHLIDSRGNGPLHYAAVGNALAMATWLIKTKKMNVNEMNIKGETPLDVATNLRCVAIKAFVEQNEGMSGAAIKERKQTVWGSQQRISPRKGSIAGVTSDSPSRARQKAEKQ